MAKRRPLVYPRMGVNASQPPLLLETAAYRIDPTEESVAPTTFDVYICHPLINVTTFKARKKSTAISLVYGTASIWQQVSSPWYDDLEADALTALGGEANLFFHNGAQVEANRIEHLAGVTWTAKPSAALGAFVAAYHVANQDPFFQGVYADESQGDLPNGYWDEYKLDTNLNLTDADRPEWDARWKAMVSAYLHGLKGVWQDEMVVTANSAGAVYPMIDGITIEANHINTMGLVEARNRFVAQERFWQASPWKYRRLGGPVNIAWNHTAMQESKLVLAGNSSF